MATYNESLPRMPGGFPHLTVAFSALLLTALAAFTLSALLNESLYALVVLGLSVPILILALTRSATRARDRVHPSR
jgi:hypothetical protein